MTANPFSRCLLVTALAILAADVPVPAITLTEHANQNPLVIQTIHPGEKVDLGKDNQVNNLKEGAKVLVLSGKHLSSLEGIASLTVMDEGKAVPLASVPELQLC